MFEDCGGMIKKTAGVFRILCFVAAALILVAELIDTNSYLLGSVGSVVIAMLSLIILGIVGAPIIYGFGEIVDCVKEIRDKSK